MVSYEKIENPYVENTEMKKVFIDGVLKAYTIKPLDGYIMRDKTHDTEDDNTITIGYRRHEASVGADYDFSKQTGNDENFNIVTGCGERLFYCKRAEDDTRLFFAVEKSDENKEKAQAYDILMGVTE